LPPEALRILVVNNRYPPHITGGYELSAALAVEGLRGRGHEVRVLTGTYGVGAQTDDGHVRRCLSRLNESPHPHRLAWLEWKDALTLEDELRCFRPDLVSAWNLMALFPSVLHGVAFAPMPVVFHLHDLYLDFIATWAREWQAFWQRPAAGVGRGLAKKAVALLGRRWGVGAGWPPSVAAVPIAHAVFCSDSIRRRHEAVGVLARDWRVVLSGVDVERFRPGDREPVQKTLRLLFVGRFDPSKGAHLALGAVARLVAGGCEDVRLTLMGAVPPDRSYRDELARRAEEPPLRGRVVFGGVVPNDSMPEVYRNHDVLVFPTRTPEGLPRAAMEAMACGRVVVGTSTGGGAELFEEGVNALLVTQDDEVALAQRLRELAGQPERLRALGDAARRHVVERHSMWQTVGAIEGYYHELLAARGRGPRA
jgi:glycogen(starch) synthase